MPIDGVGLCVWAILSHIVLVIFVIRACMLRDAVGISLGSLLTLTSLFYHGCQCSDRCMGISLADWQYLDHGTAPQAIIIMSFIFTIILFVGRTTRTRMLEYTLIALTLQIVALYIALKFHPLDIAPALILFSLLGAGLVLYWGVFRAEPYVKRSHPKFRARDGAFAIAVVLFVAGIVATGIGAFFFIMSDPSYMLHSWWHFFVGIGLVLLQEAAFRTPNVGAPSAAATATATEPDSELELRTYIYTSPT